jgi:hypothetical protein
MNLDELKKQEKELKDALRVNGIAQVEINKQNFIEKYGFNVGDLVKYHDSKKLVFAKVAGFDISYNEVRYIRVHLQRTNGEYTQRQKRVYNSELKTMVKQ